MQRDKADIHPSVLGKREPSAFKAQQALQCLLALLPLAENPIEREWYVMHLASRQLPHVALAFEEFLCTQGQAEIQRQLGVMPASRKAGKRRPAAAKPHAARSARSSKA